MGKKTSAKAQEAPAAAAAAAAATEEQQQNVVATNNEEKKNTEEEPVNPMRKYMVDRAMRIDALMKPPSPLLTRPTLVVTSLGREFVGLLISYDADGSVMLSEVLERTRDPAVKDNVITHASLNVTIPASIITHFYQMPEGASIPKDVRVELVAAFNQMDKADAAKAVAESEAEEAKQKAEEAAARAGLENGNAAPAEEPSKQEDSSKGEKEAVANVD